ncbi:MAG TPA: hypothetical protein VLD38_07125 [Nitrosopumilaceae archaeon]|nr:hypothetical protein [Nitrosopumilaceae archaeon]
MNRKIIAIAVVIVVVSVIFGVYFFYQPAETQTANKKVAKLAIDKSGENWIKTNATSLFTVYASKEDYVIKNGTIFSNKLLFEEKPGMEDLYNEIGVVNEPQKTVVVVPVFTASAYTEPGFYTYYNGKCDSSCLTIPITDLIPTHASINAVQVLMILGYEFVTDVDIDKNPGILKKYDKVIMLHSEYVTKKEFDAITNHPKVLYLYPNALYAEIKTDYDKNMITLIRGHSYPSPDIGNGFGWKFDNTNYEYDHDCFDMKFYKIDNGMMLNCWPEDIIHTNKDLLKSIKKF